jgi:hypothetical protein
LHFCASCGGGDIFKTENTLDDFETADIHIHHNAGCDIADGISAVPPANFTWISCEDTDMTDHEVLRGFVRANKLMETVAPAERREIIQLFILSLHNSIAIGADEQYAMNHLLDSWPDEFLYRWAHRGDDYRVQEEVERRQNPSANPPTQLDADELTQS